MKKLIYLFTALLLVSCMPNKKESNEINIYSQRHYNVDEIQYQNFEKLTGIKVNVTKANADELIQRMKNEGENSPADLFITVDVGKLWQGGEMGLFQKFQDESVFANIDPQLLDKNGYWVPVTYRSRVIVYSNERVEKNELSTYEDLSNEKWKGRLLVRSSSNAYNQALMSSLVENLGTENTTKWSEGVVSNFARDPKGSDRDQVKAIAAGQGDIAIVNSYYIGLLLSSLKDEEINAGNSVSVFFPNQADKERGAHINISGLALTKNAPNRENAIKLIQYLTSIEAQKTYVSNSYEYSVNPDVKPDEIVQSWGEFKKDPVDLNSLGTNRSEAIRIFDKTGWK
ncbi:extracellular solute-binding protein [Flavobacteriaceae bacterium]|nr:extracellular solute-binding protein [Flavobacteriaceae bacterium]